MEMAVWLCVLIPLLIVTEGEVFKHILLHCFENASFENWLLGILIPNTTSDNK
jgi:hypothetical protein